MKIKSWNSNKTALLVILFFSSSLLYSIDLDTFINIGNLGIGAVNVDEQFTLFAVLPTLNIIDRDTNIGLSLESATFRLSEDIDTNILNLKAFWTPPIFDNSANDIYFIFGPFIDISFLNSNVGIKYSIISNADLFKINLPWWLKFKVLDIEAGYSLTDKNYYISTTTDIVYIAMGMIMFLTDLNLNNQDVYR